MAVVCDTTPINYLVQIGLIDLVPRLFGNACIPEAVLSELLHPSAPRNVREFASALPEWMVVKTAVEIKEPAILALDKGEREAIALSVSLGAEFLLTDDYKARVVARQLGIATLTTLLILDAAADRGWINFHEAVQRLLETNFRVDPLTIAQLAEKHA